MILYILWPKFYGKPESKCCKVKGGGDHVSGVIPFIRFYLLVISGSSPREQTDEEWKRTVITSGSATISQTCSSQIQLWREAGCVGRDVGQRGRTLERGVWNVLTTGAKVQTMTIWEWSRVSRSDLPGNILFNCCTSIKKHDHPNDRRWDKEWCIQPQPSKIQPNFLSKILPGKPRKKRKWNTY